MVMSVERISTTCLDEFCLHEGTGRKSHHPVEVKSGLVTRLNRIEGQVRGIKRLIEQDSYCDDVLNQIASVQSALNGVGKLLLEHHMKSCVNAFKMAMRQCY